MSSVLEKMKKAELIKELVELQGKHKVVKSTAYELGVKVSSLEGREESREEEFKKIQSDLEGKLDSIRQAIRAVSAIKLPGKYFPNSHIGTDYPCSPTIDSTSDEKTDEELFIEYLYELTL